MLPLYKDTLIDPWAVPFAERPEGWLIKLREARYQHLVDSRSTKARARRSSKPKAQRDHLSKIIELMTPEVRGAFLKAQGVLK